MVTNRGPEKRGPRVSFLSMNFLPFPNDSCSYIHMNVLYTFTKFQAEGRNGLVTQDMSFIGLDGCMAVGFPLICKSNIHL